MAQDSNALAPTALVDKSKEKRGSSQESPQEPLVSLIVVNWNGEKVLDDCLYSLRQQTYKNWELIIVDNASSDKSVDIVREYFPDCNLLELKENLGFAAGNNLGIQIAKGKYVILLNNDTQVQANFIHSLVSEAERDPRVSSVGCKIIQHDGSIHYGPMYSIEGGFIFGRRISDYVSHTTEADSQFDQFAHVAANCGCAVLFRKSTLDKIGLLDPFLRSNWEDHDLGLRMNLAGYDLTYTPRTTVLHLGGHSEGSAFSFKRFALIVRNTWITYYKNLEIRNTLSKMPIVLLLYLGFRTKEWLSGKQGKFLPLTSLGGIAKGLYDFLRDLPETQRKRLSVQRLRTVSDKELLSRTSIYNIPIFKIARRAN